MIRVALTQPAPRVHRLASALQRRGHSVAVLSCQRIDALTGPEYPVSPLHDLARFDWVVFVSPGAIAVALDGFAGPWPGGTGIGVIGPGSALALAEHGLESPAVRVVQPVASPYDADALMRQAPFDAPAGLRILVLRGERGRTDWIERLRGAGASVQARSVYRAVSVQADEAAICAVAEWSAQPQPVHFTFSSVDGIDAVSALLRERGLLDWACTQPAIALHPKQAAALGALGWQRVHTIAPGEQALLAAIESA